MGPTDDQVVRAFSQAPDVIQESLSGGIAVDFMSSLTARYGIHIDTSGYVMEFIRNMLLGLLRPEEFVSKLHSVGIDEVLARKITADLNKEVFIPLRDAVRDNAGVRAPSIPHVPVMKVAATAVTPSLPTETEETPSYNLIAQKTVPPSSPEIPVTPAPSAIQAPVPTMRTMQHDIDLVQHGASPAMYPAPQHIETHSPQPATPARMFQTASVPFTSPSPQHVTQPAAEIPTPIIQPSRPVQPPTAVPKPTSDPYREPI